MLLLRKLKLKKVLLIDRLDSRERMDACLLSNDVLSAKSSRSGSAPFSKEHPPVHNANYELGVHKFLEN